MAETTEKHSLLRKIFPTHEHERLMELTKEKNNEKKGLLRQKNEELKRLRNEFDPDTCKETLADQNKLLSEADNQYKKSRKALEDISAKIALARGLLQYFEEEESLLKSSAELEKEEESMRDIEAGLALAKQAQAFRSSLDDLERRVSEIASRRLDPPQAGGPGEGNGPS